MLGCHWCTHGFHSITRTGHPLLSPVLPGGAKKVFVFSEGIFCSHRNCGWDSQLVAATGTPVIMALLSNASDAQGRFLCPLPRAGHSPAPALVSQARPRGTVRALAPPTRPGQCPNVTLPCESSIFGCRGYFSGSALSEQLFASTTHALSSALAIGTLEQIHNPTALPSLTLQTPAQSCRQSRV